MTNLPQGWEVKKLGDIIKLKNGFAFKSNLFYDIGIPIIRIKNIQNENIILDDLVFCNPDDYKNNLDNYLIFKNDILIAMSGATTGKIGLYNLNDKAYLNQRIGLLRIDNNILRKYIFWFLYCNSEKNLTNAFGAAQPNLSTEQIHNIQIPLPPLKEQERIVGILDESFANIDENIKILEQDLLNLDELMQSALQKAFNPLKDDTKENYKLPESWEWKNLGEICEINPRNKVDDEINISFVSMDKILDGYNNGFFYVIKKWKDVKNSFTHFKQGDIGLAKITPCFENKKSVIFNNLENGIGAGTTELHIIRVGNGVISKFLLWFFKTEKFIKNGILNMTGTTGHKRIPKDFIKNLQIPLPPLKEQEQIVSYLDELSLSIKNLKQNYQTQIKDLQELKQSLLDKAFKGIL